MERSSSTACSSTRRPWAAALGPRLAQDAIARARRDGARRIDVIANPRAEGFYARLGFAPGEAVATRFDTARRMSLEL